jgi:excisionase family DNA binding protein
MKPKSESGESPAQEVHVQACQRKHFEAYGEPLNYPVDVAAWTVGIGRSTLWEMIKLGLVKTVRIGRRRLVPREEVHRIGNGIAKFPTPSGK